MNWKWGGPMNNKGKCIYYVEGPCEQQLIAALKESPSRNQVVSRLQQLYSMFKSSNWAKRSKNNPVIKRILKLRQAIRETSEKIKWRIQKTTGRANWTRFAKITR